MDELMKLHQFPNTGFAIFNLDEKDLAPIKKEIKKIQKDFSKAVPFNSELAGNIEKEYSLIDSKEHLQNILQGPIQNFENSFGTYKDYVRLQFSEVPNLLLEKQIGRAHV